MTKFLKTKGKIWFAKNDDSTIGYTGETLTDAMHEKQRARDRKKFQEQQNKGGQTKL